MMKQMKKFTKTLIESFLMVMRWTSPWSLWKENMVQLILTIIYVMVNISSNFLHIRIPFNQTWVLMDKLFNMAKLYVKEPISFQSILILIIMFYKKKSNNTIVYLRTIINSYVNGICYDSKDIVPVYLRSTSHNDYNICHPYISPWENMIL